MSMLAEPKRKQKYSLNPRGKLWSEGKQNKFQTTAQLLILCDLFRFEQVRSKTSRKNGLVARKRLRLERKWHNRAC